MSKWVRILAAEDDELVRMALERSLKLSGFRVYSAEDVPAGLQLAKGEKTGTSLVELDDAGDGQAASSL